MNQLTQIRTLNPTVDLAIIHIHLNLSINVKCVTTAIFLLHAATWLKLQFSFLFPNCNYPQPKSFLLHQNMLGQSFSFPKLQLSSTNLSYYHKIADRGVEKFSANIIDPGITLIHKQTISARHHLTSQRQTKAPDIIKVKRTKHWQK